MDLRKIYSIDKEAAETGKWFKLSSKTGVKVAKLGNPAFVAEVARQQKPHISVLRSTKIDHTDLINEITVQAMARTILLDWYGIYEDGVEVKYSIEKAEEYLTDLEEFKEAVSQLAVEANNFRPEVTAGK